MAGFNDIRDRVKNIWMKGMDSIGSTAASIASNTRYKVDEMNLQNRRRDLAQDLSGRVYSLWQKGEAFPPEIEKLLKELQHVDETAQGEPPAPDAAAQAAGSETPEAPDAPETPEDGEGAARETEFMTDLEAHMQRTMEDTSSALKQEINARFDQPDVEEKAEKVNSALAQLSDQIKRFDEKNGDQEQP